MTLIEHFFLSSFPWTSGTLLATGFALAASRDRASLSNTLLIAGVGGPIGYVLFAAILNTGAGAFFFDDRNMGVLKILSGLQSAALICVSTFAIKRSGDFSIGGSLRSPITYILLLLGVSLAVLAYSAWWLPALGWDVLDHWAIKAHQLVEQLRTGAAGELVNTHRHPNTLKLLLAWNAWTSEQMGSNAFLLLPWLLMTLSLQFVLFAFSVLISGSVALGLLVAMGAVSVPLMENHILLAGYAEFPIAVFLCFSCIFIAVGLQRQRIEYLGFGAALAVALISLKGSGLLYALLPLTGLLLTYGYESRRHYGLLLICLMAGSLCVLIFSLVFEVNGNLLGFDGYRFRAFGWRTGLTDVSAIEISRNLIYAYGVNSSFALLFVAMVAFFSLLLSEHISRSELFLVLTITLGLTLLAATQLTSYGFRHARVGFDTGNSRFSLPVMMLVWLTVPYAYKLAEKAYNGPASAE